MSSTSSTMPRMGRRAPPTAAACIAVTYCQAVRWHWAQALAGVLTRRGGDGRAGPYHRAIAFSSADSDATTGFTS